MARWSRILLVLIIAMILALPGTATARYVVELGGGRLADAETAYVMTVHKSQG